MGDPIRKCIHCRRFMYPRPGKLTCSNACRVAHHRLVHKLAAEGDVMEITEDGRRIFRPELTAEDIERQQQPWSPSERQKAGYAREVAHLRAKYGSEAAEAAARFFLAGRVTLFFDEDEKPRD